MNECKIYLHFGTVETDEDSKLDKIIKACKIISDMLPNPQEFYQIHADLKEILPKLIKSMPILHRSISILLRCLIDKFAYGEDVALFLDIFFKEFIYGEEHMQLEMEEYILYILEKMTWEDYKSTEEYIGAEVKLQEFFLNRYFKQLKLKRAILVTITQTILLKFGKVGDALLGGTQYITIKKGKVKMSTEHVSSSDVEEEMSSEEGNVMNIDMHDQQELADEYIKVKKQLKTANKMHHLEHVINSGSLSFSENRPLLEQLSKRKLFDIFIKLVAKPMQYECNETWELKEGIDLYDPLIFINYNHYTLPLLPDAFIFHINKFSDLDYVNMHRETKAIFRAYLVTRMILSYENFELLQETMGPTLNTIQLTVRALKAGFQKEFQGNREHTVKILEFLIYINPLETIPCILEANILLACLDIIDNPIVSQLLLFILTLQSTFPSYPDLQDQILIYCKKCDFFQLIFGTVICNRSTLDLKALQTNDSLSNSSLDSSVSPMNRGSGDFKPRGSTTFELEGFFSDFGLMAVIDLCTNYFSVILDTTQVLQNIPFSEQTYGRTIEHLFGMVGKHGVVLDYLLKTYLNSNKGEKNVSIECGLMVNKVLHRALSVPETIQKSIEDTLRKYIDQIQKYLIEIYQAKSIIDKLILPARTVLHRTNPTKLIILQTLIGVMQLNPDLCIYIRKETWRQLIKTFFAYKDNNVFHTAFFQLYDIVCTVKNNEKIFINSVISQNVFSSLLNILEARIGKKELHQTYEHDSIHIFTQKWIGQLLSIEGPINYPELNKQFKCSASWRKLKQIILDYPEYSEKLGKFMKELPIDTSLAKISETGKSKFEKLKKQGSLRGLAMVSSTFNPTAIKKPLIPNQIIPEILRKNSESKRNSGIKSISTSRPMRARKEMEALVDFKKTVSL